MRKALLILILILCALSAFAQMQQGYVKTRGRLVNGQVVAGRRLSGVTVQVKGRNAVVSKANGTFSFPVPANRFSIQSVKKQGYVLVDPEVTARQYSYSTNPLILVLETPSQRISDKLETERKLRKTLTRQLEKQEDEIEHLKEQNKLTEEQYHQALQELYAEQEKSMNLVSQMAERYSRIDFDQLDEFNRRVSECIIEGRLTEADSLIKSKGDLKERIATHNKHHEANVEARKHLEDSEAMEIKDREDLAQDCYSQFLIHKLQHHPDSAAYYIEQRALLDTTNVDWLYDAANYFKESGKYDKSLALFLMGHNQSDGYNDADLLKNAAEMYSRLGYDDKAIPLFEEAIERYKELASDSIRLLFNLYNCYSRLGTCNVLDPLKREKANYYYKLSHDLEYRIDSLFASDYLDLESYSLIQDHTFGNDNAIKYYKRILEAMEAKFGRMSIEVANQYRKIALASGLSGLPKNDITDALDYYETAFDIFSKIDSLNPAFGDCYRELAMLYRYQRDRGKMKVIDCHEKYIAIYTMNYGKYHPSFYSIYLELADKYSSIGNDTMALQNLNNAVELKMKLYGDSADIASAYFRIAGIYERRNNDSIALKYFLLALDNSQKWAEKTSQERDRRNIAAYEDRLASFYFRHHNYESALELFLNLPYETYKSDIAYGKIGLCYIALSDTCTGLDYLFSTFESFQEKLKDGFPDDIKDQIENSIKLKQSGFCHESLHSVLKILENLNVDDGQIGSYGATLDDIQRSITKLREALLQVLNE